MDREKSGKYGRTDGKVSLQELKGCMKENPRLAHTLVPVIHAARYMWGGAFVS